MAISTYRHGECFLVNYIQNHINYIQVFCTSETKKSITSLSNDKMLDKPTFCRRQHLNVNQDS